MFQTWNMRPAFSQSLIFTAPNGVWEGNTRGSPCEHTLTYSNLFTWDIPLPGPGYWYLYHAGTSWPTFPDMLKLVQLGPHHTGTLISGPTGKRGVGLRLKGLPVFISSSLLLTDLLRKDKTVSFVVKVVSRNISI